jgi:hypothetical protein
MAVDVWLPPGSSTPRRTAHIGRRTQAESSGCISPPGMLAAYRSSSRQGSSSLVRTCHCTCNRADRVYCRTCLARRALPERRSRSLRRRLRSSDQVNTARNHRGVQAWAWGRTFPLYMPLAQWYAPHSSNHRSNPRSSSSPPRSGTLLPGILPTHYCRQGSDALLRTSIAPASSRTRSQRCSLCNTKSALKTGSVISAGWRIRCKPRGSISWRLTVAREADLALID